MTLSGPLATLLVECGALMRGHFTLTSGKHSDVYFEKFRALENPEVTRTLVSGSTDELKGFEASVVVGPTTGGALVAYEVASQLGVRSFYAERAHGERALRRGFTLKPGERVLLADDVLTTGGSLVATAAAVEQKEGRVVGAFVLVDRSGGRAALDYPLVSALTMEAVAWEASECPLCARGEPVTTPGRGG